MNGHTRRRRTVHFVPGGNERFFAKGLDAGADTLVLDLEDSVAPDHKPAARAAVADWLGSADATGPELMVRINALDTDWWRDDVDAVVAAGATSLMVPKVSSPVDLDTLDAVLPGGVTCFPVVTETAAGVIAAPDVAAHRRVDGVCWGGEDLSADLGAARVRDDRGAFLGLFEVVQSWCLLAAASAGVGAVDAVWTDLQDLDGLRAESARAAEQGFDGKITIHPDQIEIVNEAFTPSDSAVAQAAALLAAAGEHIAEGRLSFRFEGQMVDAPHLRRAERVLARAGVAR